MLNFRYYSESTDSTPQPNNSDLHLNTSASREHNIGPSPEVLRLKSILKYAPEVISHLTPPPPPPKHTHTHTQTVHHPFSSVLIQSDSRTEHICKLNVSVSTVVALLVNFEQSGLRLPEGVTEFSSTEHSDRIWCPPNLLTARYGGGGGLFPRE